MMVESADGAHALLGRSRGHRPGMLTCLSGFIDQAESIGGRSPFFYRLTLGLAKQSRSETKTIVSFNQDTRKPDLPADSARRAFCCRPATQLNHPFTQECCRYRQLGSGVAANSRHPRRSRHGVLGRHLQTKLLQHVPHWISLQQHPSSSTSWAPLGL